MNYIHPFIERLPRRIILLAALAIVSTLTACQTQKAPIDTSSAQSVERDARAHLPVGSSEASVTTYLDQRGIHYHWMEQGETMQGNSAFSDQTSDWSILGFPTLTASILPAGTDSAGYYLYFRFDQTKSTLIDIAVHNAPSR